MSSSSGLSLTSSPAEARFEPLDHVHLVYNVSASFNSSLDAEGDSENGTAIETLSSVTTGLGLYILSFVTFVGNAMVLHAIRTEKRLQTVSNMFIMSLAMADLTVGLIVMPISSAYAITGDWRFGWVVCQFWLSVDYTASTASIFNLFILSLDRYWSITSPLRYLRRRTKKRALIMIALAWTGAAMWMIPVLGWHHFLYGGKRKQPGHVCETEFATNITFKVVTSILNFYIPTTCMIVLYVRIFLAIKRRSSDIDRLGLAYVSNNHQGHQPSKDQDPGNDSLTDHEGQVERKREREHLKRQRNTSHIDRSRTPSQDTSYLSVNGPLRGSGKRGRVVSPKVQVAAISNGGLQGGHQTVVHNGGNNQWVEFHRLAVMATFKTNPDSLKVYEGVRVQVEYISDGESDNQSSSPETSSLKRRELSGGGGSSNSFSPALDRDDEEPRWCGDDEETRSKDSPVTLASLKKVVKTEARDENTSQDAASTAERRQGHKKRAKKRTFPIRPPTPRRPLSCQCQPSKSCTSSGTQIVKSVSGEGPVILATSPLEANSPLSPHSLPVIPRRQPLALNHRSARPSSFESSTPLKVSPTTSMDPGWMGNHHETHLHCFRSTPQTIASDNPTAVTKLTQGDRAPAATTSEVAGVFLCTDTHKKAAYPKPRLTTETKSQQTVRQRRSSRKDSRNRSGSVVDYCNTSLGSSPAASNKMDKNVPRPKGTHSKMTPSSFLAFLKKPSASTTSNQAQSKPLTLESIPIRIDNGSSPHGSNNKRKLSAKSSSNTSTNLNRANPKIILAKEKKAATQLGVIVGAFILCWLPYFTLFMVVAYCGKEQCVNHTLFATTTWLGYFNSALNPILYPLCNVNFKRAFKRMLRISRVESHHRLVPNNLLHHHGRNNNTRFQYPGARGKANSVAAINQRL